LVVANVLEEEYSVLRMEVAFFAETLGPTFQTRTWCFNTDVTIGIITAMKTSNLTKAHMYYNVFISKM
jgi:hypothetical protein